MSNTEKTNGTPPGGESNPTDASVDANSVQASMARLMQIYEGISDEANRQMKFRCPYKNARARCTARFECRNQHPVKNKPGEPPVCAGSDKLDYRSAWEME